MTTAGTAQQGTADFNPEVLRARYRAERDKRLRPDRNEQWVEVKGDFANYIDDPYVAPGFTRAAVTETVDAVIVGGGFGGLMAGARLRQAGINNLRIIEKAGGFGGTWYWNRYPGAQCDIDAYIYLPMLEETGYIPTQKYVFAPEILAHAERIGSTFDLHKAALFQTQITEMRWSGDEGCWIVHTDRGDVIRTTYVITASGPLNRPRLPGIEGIGSFKGHTFHTSRWDYAYTGGSTAGGLTKLADKRVAVIGTGATGVQSIPFVGQHAKHLYVFQRTPSTVDVRGNRPTDPEWVKTLQPGWQKRRIENFNTLVSGGDEDEDLVHDGWTDIIRGLRTTASVEAQGAKTPEEIAARLELADLRKGSQVRARVDTIVKDAKTAEALKAWYYMFCKRPTFNDDYLPTFNRPNVTLVDTNGKGVERITEKGLVVAGVEYEVDCIIFATGFEVGTTFTRRAAYNVIGTGGRDLGQHYANGMKTLHGYSSHGFPNHFILGLSQNGFKANFTDMLGEQVEHVVGLISDVRKKGLTLIEPTAEAETAWQGVIAEKAVPARAFLAQCTPGYYNAEGEVDRGVFLETYGGGPLEFTAMMKAWREDGQMKGLQLA